MLDEILTSVEKFYPYQLNYQKNMRELFLEMDNQLKTTELLEALLYRVETLWSPLKDYLTSYLDVLQGLIDGNN